MVVYYIDAQLAPLLTHFPRKKTLSFFTDMNNTEISSDPVCVCFCRNNQPDCGYQPLPIEIEKGKKFNLTIAAVDQVNHTLRNVTIRSSHCCQNLVD